MGEAELAWKFDAQPAIFQPEEVLRLHLSGGPEMLSLARQRIVDFARRMPYREDQVQDIRLAVGEALANACKHGSIDGHADVDVHLTRRAYGLAISIFDQGCGFDGQCDGAKCAVELPESGRGIAMMRTLMDRVEFHRRRTGTHIEMVKWL